ncbi:MAG: GC-type dockerin domain-anchored protein [Phycisphaerae bacterium]
MHRPRSLLVAALLAWGLVPTARAQWWGPAEVFGSASNPNDVWQYGWMEATLSGPLNLYTRSIEGWAGPLWGAWIGGDSTPAIWRNDTSGPAYGVGAGQLSLHPGPDGQASVLRWVNPDRSEAGTLSVAAEFFPGDFGAMRVGVRVNGVQRFEAFDFGSVFFAVPNVEVETIDFLVWGGYAYGNTPLEASISMASDRCLGDFNRDGGVDGSDVSAFFGAWESADPSADLNASGGIDGQDVETFFLRWEAGC